MDGTHENNGVKASAQRISSMKLPVLNRVITEIPKILSAIELEILYRDFSC